MLTLSIIIQSSGSGRLRSCLEALSRQTYPARDFEAIIAAPANMMDETLVGFDTPFKLRVMQCDIGDPRNLYKIGEAAIGRYCLFLSENIIASPRMVAEHLRMQHERNGVIGIGKIVFGLTSDSDFANHVLQEWREDFGKLERGEPNAFIDFHGNVSLPRSALTQSNGFAVDVAQNIVDRASYHLNDDRLSITFIPNATGRMDYHNGFRSVAAEAKRAGISSYQIYTCLPAILPCLRLGAFNDMGPSFILLRRFLLAIGIPSFAMAVSSLLISKRSWKEVWYRFLYSYYYWQGVRLVATRDVWLRLTRGPVILAYHAFVEDGERGQRYFMPQNRFARQLAWLKLRRYTVLSLDDLVAYRRNNILPPAYSVVITIDDGYADNESVAYPILRRYGFPVTIFLVSGFIGKSNRWDHDSQLSGCRLLSWTEIHKMQNDGVRFGAHTRNHVALTDVEISRAKEEVESSRAELEKLLGRPVLTFCYPYGKNNPGVQKIVTNAGFVCGCSFQSGVNDPAISLFALRRTEIHGKASLLRFALTLWVGKGYIMFRRRSTER